MMAMAKDPNELEIVSNQALEMINEWMKSTGSVQTEQKREAVLITKKRKFKLSCFELNGFEIPLKDRINYLRVWIDKNWSFKSLVTEAAK